MLRKLQYWTTLSVGVLAVLGRQVSDDNLDFVIANMIRKYVLDASQAVELWPMAHRGNLEVGHLFTIN